ncbi:hypothetical protein [Inquilinus sp. Marseille-Q2685]|uniref:hypothetical protein n=1 Tax=Inquilinus sp. Marseille-Q2685 TaxID=2866581 RepID=UPI001CE48015|nr:hypothetical protein [Inquilinus sp. Marseille-Q2685]
MRVTNIAPGPRFLRAQGRARLLEPGETAELDLTEAEAANVRRQVEAGELAWGAEPPAGAGPKVVHRGFGRHYIIGPGGEDLAGPLRKEQAAAELDRRLGQGG